MPLKRVTFIPLDYYYPKLDKFAITVANFLINNKSQFSKFCEFMRISSTWDISNYMNKFQKWASKVRGRKKHIPSDTQQLIDIALDIYRICDNRSEIQKLRGLIPEKLMQKIFLKRYLSKKINHGYGAMVNIDGKNVLYRCTSQYDNGIDKDTDKSTIDVGIWDGLKGEFAEVKLSPQVIYTRDIKYLRILSGECNNSGINHEIYLVALDQDREFIQYQLEGLNLWDKNEFTLIGSNDIFMC